MTFAATTECRTGRRPIKQTISSFSLRPFWRASASLLALLATAGCHQPEPDVLAFVHDWETSVSAADYRVQPPDTLEISSAEAPEIDGEVQTIRQDGKITLRLLGEVKVAGMTPVEIARKLESLLRKYYVDPNVNVRVNDSGSKNFFVFGQVSRPGPYAYTGRDTLINALAMAQPTFIAAKEMVKVIRPSHEPDRRHVLTVNTFAMVEEGDFEKNILLQEGDIVYVPPTIAGWIGLRIQEILFPATAVAQTFNVPANSKTSVDTFERN